MKRVVSSVLGCLAGALLVQAVFAETDSATPHVISSLPYSITNGGTYYLASNLTGRGGILVSASDVTIDLKGFTLTGDHATNSGIFAFYNVKNLTVRNGAINGWNGHGIYAETVVGCRVTNIDVGSNAFTGLDLGDQCEIASCKVYDNGTSGILTGEKATIKDTTTRANRGDGLRTGANSQIIACTSLENRGSGIVIGRKSVVRDCTAVRNLQSGIFVNQPDCQLIGNTSSSNNYFGFLTSAGIYIFDSNNRVESNRLIGNGYAGISVATGYTNNVIVKNVVTGSGKNNYLVPPGNEVDPLASTSGPNPAASNSN